MNISRLREGRRVTEAYANRAQAAGKFDVVVAGLGTAGAIAAITAAELGLKVAAVERLNCMGGTGTAGAVIGYYFGSKGGRYEAIDREVRAAEKDVYTPTFGVNSEAKKLILEQKALELGVEIHYDTTVTGVLLDGRKVCGLETFGPDGLHVLESSVVIDATGDAAVAKLAGCELRMGRAVDRQAQPFSNAVFLLRNNRVSYLDTDAGYVDPNDPDDLSRAIIQSALLKSHLKDEYTDELRMLRIAPLLGVRESNFIVSEDDITFRRFIEEDFPAPVFFAYSNLDNHSKDVALESEAQQDWTVACSLWGLNFSVPVPLGALIPKGFDGLLVAGRCLGVDHDMAACVRMKRDMQKCGEAAAVAAGLAVKYNVPLKQVPYAELVETLRRTGCFDGDRGVVYKEIVNPAEEENTPIFHWLTDQEAIKAGLSGDKPGIAIWSAKRMGEAIAGELKAWLAAEHEHLRKNSAFALALMGDEAAKPVLRQMVYERDPYIPRTSRKYNQARGYTAIYLLGKLRDQAIVPELIDIMEKPQQLVLQTDNHEFIADEDELYFQYFSFSVMALSKIGDAHPVTRPTIVDCFERFLARRDVRLEISFKGQTFIKHDMTEKMKHVVRKTLDRWQTAALSPQSV